MLQSPYRALGTASHPNIPFPIPFAASTLSPVARKLGLGQPVDDGMTSESGRSSASPMEMRTCFCGNTIIDGEGIYCSAGCARSDAFSTLCNKPNPPSSLLASVQSCDLSRNPSDASTSTTSSGTSDWESTHYGRMCRADLRREERKEERRRRRAEGGNASIASSSTTSSSRGTMTSVASSSRVPDLIGGGSHSRNASIASSRTSFSSTGGLSRQCSNASSTSRRGYGGGVQVDTVIMEDDDEEEEWLVSDSNYESKYPLPTLPKYRVQQYPNPHQRRRGSNSKPPGHGHGHGHGKKKLEPFGMGKDMRDVLEEIIQMEKEFVIDETSDDQLDGQEMAPGVFTAVFDRPPRTPSPSLECKRESVVPGAPLRGAGGGGHHRKSVSMANAASPPPIHRPHARPRPPSTYGHSASLSESHTALYLATASPESGRRSASPPRLKARNSMTFTPEAAGPVIPSFFGHSPNLSTPSRRRPLPSPSAHHPTMSGWRFPNSNTATPTKLTIDTQNLEVPTPTRPRQPGHPASHAMMESEADMHPHLLWPPNLAPSLFPMSPGMNGTPILDPASRFRQQVNTSPTAHHAISPPNSGVRLGYLLGSGEEDVDMDMDDESTAHGHGHGQGRGFLPVYLRDEGYRQA